MYISLSTAFRKTEKLANEAPQIVKFGEFLYICIVFNIRMYLQRFVKIVVIDITIFSLLRLIFFILNDNVEKATTKVAAFF